MADDSLWNFWSRSNHKCVTWAYRFDSVYKKEKYSHKSSPICSHNRFFQYGTWSYSVIVACNDCPFDHIWGINSGISWTNFGKLTAKSII